MADTMERWARKGFLAIAFDAPYHGERALPQAGLTLARSCLFVFFFFF